MMNFFGAPFGRSRGGGIFFDAPFFDYVLMIEFCGLWERVTRCSLKGNPPPVNANLMIARWVRWGLRSVVGVKQQFGNEFPIIEVVGWLTCLRFMERFPPCFCG